MSKKIELLIQLPDDKEITLYTDWDYYNGELAFSKLKDVCFWNKWDFNECLAFIEGHGVSWIEVSNTMITGMSIAEACDIVKNKNIKKDDTNLH